LSYGGVFDFFPHAASLVEKIFKGAKSGDLPIEQTTRFFLAVNMKTAKTLDIVIPPSLLARTDEVIECICGFHACGIVAQCWPIAAPRDRRAKRLAPAYSSCPLEV